MRLIGHVQHCYALNQLIQLCRLINLLLFLQQLSPLHDHYTHQLTVVKYNIPFKALPMLVCMKHSTRGYLVVNASLGFASCCINHSKLPSCCIFHTHSRQCLNYNTYIKNIYILYIYIYIYIKNIYILKIYMYMLRSLAQWHPFLTMYIFWCIFRIPQYLQYNMLIQHLYSLPAVSNC